MEKETDSMRTFDMDALKINLPQNRRGLSRYYSGKSRSFACMDDVHCLEDLKKQERPRKKSRKQQQQQMQVHHPLPCHTVSSGTHCASAIVGV